MYCKTEYKVGLQDSIIHSCLAPVFIIAFITSKIVLLTILGKKGEEEKKQTVKLTWLLY